jgi:hypothetical protein
LTEKDSLNICPPLAQDRKRGYNMNTEYKFVTTTKEEITIFNENKIDDTHLILPLGYETVAVNKRLLKSIKIENNNDFVVREVFPLANRKDLRSVEKILSYLQVHTGSLSDCLKVYAFIYDNIFHSSSEFSEESRDVIKMINWWGYCLCGHNATVLKKLLSELGVSSRRIPLNGHAVNEYEIGGKAIVLDGDVKAHYFSLDNTTLCCFQKIIEDPFLIYRTLR